MTKSPWMPVSDFILTASSQSIDTTLKCRYPTSMFQGLFQKDTDPLAVFPLLHRHFRTLEMTYNLPIKMVIPADMAIANPLWLAPNGLFLLRMTGKCLP